MLMLMLHIQMENKMAKQIKPAKYIVTMGPFDDQTNNLKIAKQELKIHIKKMKKLYNSNETYSIYMLVESKSIKDYK